MFKKISKYIDEQREMKEMENNKKLEMKRAIERIEVFTLPGVPNEFDPVTMVWSDKIGEDLEWSLKEQAYYVEADAVIGLTFQTYGHGTIRTKHGGLSDGDIDGSTSIKSICYGTAIRYKQQGTGM